MKKYVTPHDSIEASGHAVSTLIANILSDETKPVLAQMGFDNIDLEAWYPQQYVLDALKLIHDNVGDSLALVAVGRQVIDSAVLPPIDSFEEAIGAISMIFDLNHRNHNETVGIFMEPVGEGHLQVTNCTPYPDDLIYGYLFSLIRRFSPENASPTLRYRNAAAVNTEDNMVYDITY